MPLPNLEKMVPTFQVTIPSTQQVVTFRPFLVKEEKILLIALEADEEKAMLDAVIQMITSCAVSPLKVDTLASFDLEYIFLQLRTRSVNEVAELAYRCHSLVTLTPAEFEERYHRGPRENDNMKVSCDHIVKLPINLDTIQVQFNPNHKKQIFLTDTMGVNMRYPNYKMGNFSSDESGNINEILQRISMCIESVFDSESVYTGFTTKEIAEWIEKLTQTQFLKLEEFFDTMPVLAHDVLFHCPSCDYQETIRIEGLASFFV
jgi:hypothetical protein